MALRSFEDLELTLPLLPDAETLAMIDMQNEKLVDNAIGTDREQVEEIIGDYFFLREDMESMLDEFASYYSEALVDGNEWDGKNDILYPYLLEKYSDSCVPLHEPGMLKSLVYFAKDKRFSKTWFHMDLFFEE